MSDVTEETTEETDAPPYVATDDSGDSEGAGEDDEALTELISAVRRTNDDEDDDDDSGITDTDQLLYGGSYSTSREVMIIIPPVPPSKYEYNKDNIQRTRKPSTKMVEKNQEKLIDFESDNRTKSRTKKIICGIITMLAVLGVGVSMLVLARTLTIPDLYIIGIIFTAGGTCFTVGFLYMRCMYDRTPHVSSEPLVVFEKVQ